MIHNLIGVSAFAVGLFIAGAWVAVWWPGLPWWSWFPVRYRPLTLILLGLLNIMAIISVVLSRRVQLSRLQIPGLVLNSILLAMNVFFHLALLFLKYCFRM